MIQQKKSDLQYKVRAFYRAWAPVYDASVKQGLPYLVEENVLCATIDPQKNERILDVGCGTGRVSAQLFAGTKNVVGIDVSEEMLAVARKKLPRLKFLCADASYLPFADGMFDKVVSSLTFQFLPDVKTPLREIRRVLKKGGKAFITDFVTDAPLDWREVKYKKEKTFSGSVRTLSTFHTISEYKKAAQRCGLTLLQIIPLNVPSVARKILTTGSYKKIKGSYASVLFVFQKKL